MNTPNHEYPKPLWKRQPDGSVKIRYANDRIDFDLHIQNGPRATDLGTPEAGYGWSQDYIRQEYPKAVHGPKGQSVRVNNAQELEARLAAGWSLKPVGTEVPAELQDVNADPNLPPHFMNEKKSRQREPVSA